MRYLESLKKKWNIESNLQFWLIMLAMILDGIDAYLDSRMIG